MRVDVYHHFDLNNEANQKLDQILGKVDDLAAQVVVIRGKEEKMSKEMDDLTASVKANTDADDSIILLVQGLAAQIVALKYDPIALEALAAQLTTKTQAIVDAVNANTPSAPAP
jgi:uncharacterized protein YdaL